MGEFDLSLISEFRNRPSFYDRGSPLFRDKLYNARQWQEISNKLGFDVSILKDRILQLRNRYNLEKRRIEQLREENPNKYHDSPWPLYEHLHFLSNHIRARRSYKKLLPLNGNGMANGGDDAGGHFGTGHELSNSCSNNSNLTLRRRITGSGSPNGNDMEGREQNMETFPNGMLAVKMEDDSEGTEEGETGSQNNGSEINAFETSGLIPETHSSPTPVQQQQQQQQHQQTQQQQYPSISIRRLDSLRHTYSNSPPHIYNLQKFKRKHPEQRMNHTTTSINNRHSTFQNGGDEMATLLHQPPLLNAREMKYTAFGNFVSSSLSDLPPSAALELIEKFTSDIVKVLIGNAQHKQQQEEEQERQQQQHEQEQEERARAQQHHRNEIDN